MNIVAYVDESGTHDPSGNRPGSGTVAIGGLIATKEEWIAFDVQWRKILKKHKASYFHFREQFAAWRVIALRKEPDSEFKKNPYRTWSKDQLSDFVLELAPLAASKIIVAGWVPTKRYNEDKLAGHPKRQRHPYELCLDHFFNSYFTTIKIKKPSWLRQPVSFLFDWIEEDDPWRDMVMARCAFFRKQKIKRMDECGFRNKKAHTPLQAADMIAYRARWSMDKLSQLEFGKTWPEPDDILFESINEDYRARSQDEKEAILRRLFEIPEDFTYEEAMHAIIAKVRK